MFKLNKNPTGLDPFAADFNIHTWYVLELFVTINDYLILIKTRKEKPWNHSGLIYHLL